MNESKANRISKLEQHRTAADLTKEYCSCRCHRKSILDFNILSDGKDIERLSWLQELASLRGDDLLSNMVQAQVDGISYLIAL